jgi:hypothetical protein
VLHYHSDDSRGEGVDLLTNTTLSLPDELVKQVQAALEVSFGWRGCFLLAEMDADFDIPRNDAVDCQSLVWNNPDIYSDAGVKTSPKKCVVQ